MIKKAKDYLFFPAMCLVTTGLSSLELRLGTPSQLQTHTPRLLEILAEMFIKPTVWPIDSIGLKVTLHSSALIVGVVVSLIAVLAKYKDMPYLYVPWLLIAANGILENQAINAASNCIVAYSNYTEYRALLFVMVVLLMLVEEARFWLAVLHVFFAGCKHWPFVRARTEPPKSAAFRNDAGDHLADAGPIGGTQSNEVHGTPGDQGDNAQVGSSSEQGAAVNEAGVSGEPLADDGKE